LYQLLNTSKVVSIHPTDHVFDLDRDFVDFFGCFYQLFLQSFAQLIRCIFLMFKLIKVLSFKDLFDSFRVKVSVISATISSFRLKTFILLSLRTSSRRIGP
jgi:hypothetical protein